jgi:hypothetical protein
MSRRLRRSTKRQSQLASGMAEDFETTILHNAVFEDIGGDDQLAQLLDATAEAEHAQEEREAALGSDGERVNDVGKAAGILSHVARTRAREVVAEACATVIQDGDQWAAEGHYSQADVADAQHEAREWLQVTTNVSGRLGLLEEVDQ